MNKLVFFLGPAGAGKTTLAKAVANRRKAVVLDMDILLRPAAEAIMTLHGLDPSDRDSAEYKKLCRDLGYRITMDAALDNIGLNADVFVVGPFTKEAADPDWIGSELLRIGRSLQEVEVKVVWVELADEELYRTRINSRHSPLDEWKIKHWAEFRSSLRRRKLQWSLPESGVALIDNSNPDIEATVHKIEQFISAT
ncbi:AAA family ATPase [Paenibacillus albidus]|uniref:AAA family ATPase n=1 Tax=Paenibacillus albidus TaxID=2041023 RepID=UPI002034BE34|nr:AAA family ATPase [Paenibacillus albidus]